MSNEDLKYNPAEVKEIYEKRYSNFTSLPAYSLEERKYKRIFNNIFTNFKIDVKKFPNYIDIGCGLGIKTYILSEYFEKTTGIDFSQNAINIAKLLNAKPNVEFEIADVKNLSSSDKKSDFITALGLSVLNVKDIEQIKKEILNIINLYAKNESYIIISSSTDFSGSVPVGWYYHSRKDLKKLVDSINTVENLKCKIYFNHCDFKNYFFHGFETFAIELFRLLFSRKRDYFLVIKKK
ncbi:MAG: class I SAM-dependent methyltransferase [Bacteroidales bacterium]|nr:class I SAM-dependent methyltransferase [Bacteroidales bacterium]